MNPSKQAMQSQTADTEASVDPGILAFGTSVSVNDDLRRSIQTQIEEIDKESSKIVDELKAEEKVGEELRKSRVASAKEAYCLQEKGKENLEVLNTNQDIFDGFKKTLYMELLENAQEDTQARQTVDHNSTVPNGYPENLPPTNGFSMEALQNVHQSTETELGNLTEEFEATIKLLTDLGEQKKALDDECAEMLNRIQAEQLQERLEQRNQEIQDQVNDNNAELKRRSALQARINSVQVGAFEKAIRALLDEESEKQKSLDSVKKDAEKNESEAIEEERRAKTTLDKKGTEEVAETERCARIEKLLQEAEETIKSREEKKTKREAIRAARVDLLSEKNGLETRLASSKEGVETAKRAILKYESGIVATEALNEENNSIEAEKILPGQTDYESACLQRDEYLKWIQADKESTKVSDVCSEMEAVKKESALSHEELEKLRSQLQEKQTELSERKRILDEHNDACGKDLAAMDKTMEVLNEQCANESQRIEETKIRLRQEEAKTAHVESFRKMELFRSGAKLLKQTTKAEKHISDLSTDPLGLDDSGDHGDDDSLH